MMKRKCGVKVLSGEPLDGSGRVCIHLFVQDTKGPFVEPHVLHPVIKDGQVVKQRYLAKATRGRLACDPRRLVAPVTRNGVVAITPRSNDPRAVTCTKCIESIDYMDAMNSLNETNEVV